MNAPTERIFAIALKEWRLNLRFAGLFFIDNLVTPIKSSLVMLFLYAGVFKSTQSFMGVLTKETYLGYVFIGTILHSQLSTAASTVSGKLAFEKYWQTALATLLSPASSYEVLLGFAIGTGGISIFVNTVLLAGVTYFYPVPFTTFLMGVLIIFLTALFGFSLGFIGATIGLVWEGALFIYIYALQGITFLSCLYYPIGIIPRFLHPVVRSMPTYQIAEVIHSLYFGTPYEHKFLSVLYMLATCLLMLFAAGIFYTRSMRKYGIVGY